MAIATEHVTRRPGTLFLSTRMDLLSTRHRLLYRECAALARRRHHHSEAHARAALLGQLLRGILRGAEWKASHLNLHVRRSHLRLEQGSKPRLAKVLPPEIGRASCRER